MVSISFDKDEYNAGERATITYVDALARTLLAIRKTGSLIYRQLVEGSGSFEYTAPSALGTYEAVLIFEGRVRATDTMKVVSGAPYVPPPAEGETRDLDLGDYEVTWTLSGRDTLITSIRVTDTGVTCLSVTAGACNSATPPGVTISTFTVTGYLKPSGVAPPTEGYLTVNTSPAGASVTVDGVSCGTTPVTACTLSTGAKTVTITKSGYNTVTRSVTISAGATSNLGTITLTPTGAPPTGFDDWVDGKGGKDVIKGGDISELVDAFTGIGDVGFTVTGGNINKATDYYTGIG